MTFNPHEYEDVSERRTRRKAKASVDQTDMQFVCEMPQGRRVLARILQQTGWNMASFVAGDPLSTAYREGQRSVGLALHAQIINAGEHLPRAILAENVQGDD